MTTGQVLAITGGVTVTAVIAALIIIALKNKDKETTGPNITETMEFSISDFKRWISKNNPGEKNKVCVATLEAMQKDDSRLANEFKKAVKNVPEDSHCLFLATVNSDGDVEYLEIVIYDNLSKDMKEIIDNGNGILVLEE